MTQRVEFAVVTGAGSGLGRALAVRLARQGARIVLADRNLATAEATCEQVAAAGGQGEVVELDVADSTAWQQLLAGLRERWPRLDLLVNNAGVAGSGEVGRFSVDDWQWLLSTNLYGTIWGCHHAVDWLKANPGRGAILNVASYAAFASPPCMGAYNVAKSGVVALSETLYVELLKHRVHVTVLCPTFFATGLIEAARMDCDSHRTFALSSMRRAGFTADDVAAYALRAVERRQLYAVLPARARRLWLLKRWLPGTAMWLLGRVYARGLPEGV